MDVQGGFWGRVGIILERLLTGLLLFLGKPAGGKKNRRPLWHRSKTTEMSINGVPVAHHGLILSHDGATRLGKVLKYLPGL